ncbi:MAG: phosphoribosyltransferase family protein [Desulfobacterales bacterium]|jgi:hypoxanthine phosphoribosyltransferase
MSDLFPVLTRDEINKSIARMARKISSDYHERELILIGVLKGSFIFLSDLARQLSIPVKIDFLRAASYSSNSSTSGKIQLKKDIEINTIEKGFLVGDGLDYAEEYRKLPAVFYLNF